MNPLDDATLLAYAQHTLSAEQLIALELLAQSDAHVASALAAMRASRVPIGPAYAAQVQPPLPAHLRESVAALISSVTDQPVTEASTAQQSLLNESRGSVSSTWAKARAEVRVKTGPDTRASSWVFMVAAMVATFAVGTLVPTPWRQSGEAALSVAPRTNVTPTYKPWVTAIAQYQALYVRETIDQQTQELNQSQKVLSDTFSAHPMATFVPDLTGSGYQFKRVQRLGFANKPLLQMVYLGTSGNPAALCVLPIDEPDQPVTTQRIDGLNIASWQRGGLAYVFASDMPIEQTQAIAVGLLKQQFPKLL